MRQPFPIAGDVDPFDAYGQLIRLGPRRPGVRLNMISSVDAAAALQADRAQASPVAEVVVAGEVRVDLNRAVGVLGERGYGNLVAEGGPVVAARLVEAGLLDELRLTVSPLLAAGDARRILDGPVPAPPPRPGLAHVLEADGYLFLCYHRQ